MNKLFAIADLHLSFSCDKPMDIFPGWEDHASRIETNWRKVVGENDTVVVPGDISWAMTTEEARPDLDFINKLPGRKIIGRGNHDYWWNTMSKLNAFKEENGWDTISFLFNNAYEFEDYAIAGCRGWPFDEMSDESEKVLSREAGRLELSLAAAEKTGKEPLAFLHYPPIVCDSSQCREIVDVLKKYGVKYCFYGHLHGASVKNAFNGKKDGIEYRLISADSLGFCPKMIK